MLTRKDSGVSPVIAVILLIALSVILISIISASVMSGISTLSAVDTKIVGFTVVVNDNNTSTVTPVSGKGLPYLTSYTVYLDNGHVQNVPDSGASVLSGAIITGFDSNVTRINIAGHFTDGITALVFSGKVINKTVVYDPSHDGEYYVVGSEPYENASEFVDSLNAWKNGTADLVDNGNSLLLFRDIVVGDQPIVLTPEIMGSDNTLSITDGWSYVFLEKGKDNITISRAPGYTGALLVIKTGTLSSNTVQIVLDGTNQVGSAPILVIENGATLSIHEILTVINGINEGGEGGGIYNAGTLNVQTNLIVANNKAKYGGGIYNEGTSFEIHKCEIYNNVATEKGGGIYNAGSNPVDINNGAANVHDNSAVDGGGVYNAGTLTGGFPITNNIASGNGGGIYNAGSVSLTSKPLISGNSATNGGGIYNTGTMEYGGSITSNTASQKGGGIYNIGTFSTESLSLNYNIAEDGGGFYNDNLTTKLGATITYNTALNNGGGIYNSA
ncbi:MAG: type IV pilin N-terminal domain-containing protein, partial [Methanocorpusculum sp.]|nr:type IV pilin N-terminal domain-containing protein [Methanocorpusculum sp.]